VAEIVGDGRPWTVLMISECRNCSLCRRRHKHHYADLRVMPMRMRSSVCDMDFAMVRSA
jgi:hypothetical protein